MQQGNGRASSVGQASLGTEDPVHEERRVNSKRSRKQWGVRGPCRPRRASCGRRSSRLVRVRFWRKGARLASPDQPAQLYCAIGAVGSGPDFRNIRVASESLLCPAFGLG